MTVRAEADAELVWRIVDGHATYWALVTAMQTGALDAVAGGASVADAATACGADADRLVPILEALVAAGLLERSGPEYRSTPTTDGFLREGSVPDLRALVVAAPGRHHNWLDLPATLRGDPPGDPVDGDLEGFSVPLARSTFAVQRALAGRVAVQLRAAVPADAVVLDVAAGAAPWSIGFLAELPGARAVCADESALLAVAREQLERHGCADRAQLVEGSPRTTVPSVEADVVVLANVCRDEGAAGAADLIARAGRAVRPGGRLVLADYLLDAGEPARARRAAGLGVTMVANTARGSAFAAARYRTWLHDAGFADVEHIDGRPAPHDVLVAARTDEPPRERHP